MLAVQNSGNDAVIIDPQPCATREFVETGNDIGPLRSVSCRWLPWTVEHLVPVGGNHDWPVRMQVSGDNDRTHRAIISTS